MAKRFELLIFDWDGTLMDSAGVIVHSIQAALRRSRLAGAQSH
jgi:phosphoglycolate phosphatase